MISIHADALDRVSAAYHEFLLRYKASAEVVYGIVEGKEDPMFYRGIIEKSLPNGWEIELIAAGGKDKVLKAMRAFDWKTFSQKRICFFIDRDLSEFMHDVSISEDNLYVTDNYSIENDAVNVAVFKRILEEVLNISDLTPSESAAIENCFLEALLLFREAMLPVMVQVLLWRREGKRPSLNDIRPKDFFIFVDGRIRLRTGFESERSRLEHAARCVNLRSSGGSELAEAETEFRQRDGAERFIRGKYLLWFMIELALDVHRSVSSIVSRFSTPPRVRVSIGAGNAMVIVAPRVRCPRSLGEFMERTYAQYIRDSSTAKPGSRRRSGRA